MTNRPRVGVLWCGVALALSVGVVACGRPIDSGIDDNKPASELTEAEATQLCREVESAFADVVSPNERKELTCRFRGLATAAVRVALQESEAIVRQACRETYQTCLEETEPPEDSPIVQVDCEAAMVPQCSVTVGQIENCGNDVIDELNDFISKVPTCDNADLTRTTEDPAGPRTPSSCGALEVCGALDGM